MHEIETLRENLAPGQTIYTVLRRRSASGMSRSISLVVVRDGSIWDITYFAARALDHKVDQKNGGVKVSGCGMDMGFHLVYELGRCLWSEGTPKPQGTRNGEPDRDGGYALRHQWL